MARRPRIVVATVIALVVVGSGLAWGWWYMASGRFPFAGDLSHDFGEVPIPGVTVSVEHRFTLRNRRDRPLVIQRIQPSCGCTTVKTKPQTVGPGESIDLDVALHLNKAGRKRARVELFIEDFGIQSLFVQAVGRKATSVTINQVSLPLLRGVPNPLLVIAEIESTDDEPPPPTVLAPDGVTVEFISWQPVHKRNPRTGTAAQWRGKLMVALEAETLPPDATLEVRLGEAGSASVPLTPISADPPAASDRDAPAGEGSDSGE